ncbi:hypothetical protein NT05LI_1554 [Listeria ivanovii FSL F6-596]|nr:hypothetical protein NT05LI_1554 [Listeria ivanovii FSL F6-596]
MQICFIIMDDYRYSSYMFQFSHSFFFILSYKLVALSLFL